MHFFINALIAFLLSFPALAEEPVHGIAMHGQPQYGEDFQKLNYVSEEATKGGDVVFSEIGTFDTLNAYNIKGKKAAGLDYLYDPLMARVWDEPFSLYGLVAKHVIIPEDRSEITYVLDERAVFHDGQPITAEDVAFSFEKHKAHGKPVTRRVYGLVKEYQILSPQKIKFVFGEGHDKETAMILSLMRIIPKHYWQSRAFDQTILEPPLGSGPYKITDVDVGRRIAYERVKDYWAQDLPINRYQYNFDHIIYDYYRDETVAFEALKAGAIDVWRENDIGRWLSSYRNTDINTQEFKHGRPEWLRALIMNMRKPQFQDENVRKALYLAFPYKWINKNIYHDAFKPITSVFPNSELASSEMSCPLVPITEGRQLRYPTQLHCIIGGDREKLKLASDLLKDAGWQIKNGALRKDGEPLVFEILLNNPTDEKIALIYRRHLKRLGIDVSVRTVDSAQFLGRLNDFDYDMVFYRWINSLSPGNEQYIYWGSQAADQIGTRNYAGIKNQQVDEAIDDMVRAETRDDLLLASQNMDAEIMRNFYLIPLFYKGFDAFAFSNGIAYPQITPVYGPVLETWWRAPSE